MALRLVDENYRPEGYSVRVTQLSDEHLADLQWLATHVLTSADLAVAELRNAIGNRDRDASIAACRRLLACGLMSGDRARQMEREQ